MLLEVIATAVGGTADPYVLEVEDNGEWTCKDAGGWHDATFTAKSAIPYSLRPELSGARVMLQGVDKPAFFGRVIGCSGDTLSCQGFYHELAEHEAGGIYTSASLSQWREWSEAGRASIDMREEFGWLRFVWTKDTAYLDTMANGAVCDLPRPQTGVTVTFNWARPTDTSHRIEAWSGVVNLSSTTGELYTWTQEWQQTQGSGLTGTQTLTFGGTINAVLLVARTNGARTPTGDESVVISNLRVLGAGLTAPVKAHTLLSQFFGHLPTSPITDFGDPGVDIPDLVLDAGATAFEGVSKVLGMQDWSLTSEPRLSGSIYKPGFVFRANDTTPYYTADIGSGEVVADIEPVDWSSLASRVLVRYKTSNGRGVSVWVTDSDASHYLVARGITKDASIDVDTTSTAVAQAAGAAWLAQIGGVAPVSGTVTVTGSLNGEIPANIEPGRWIRLTSETGAMLGRIREVRHIGLYKAVLTLNNTLTLDDILRGVRA